ncbi:MAG: O-antigen ligase family protein [Bacilli bacterium]
MLTYLAYIYLIKFDVNYIGLSTAYPTRESRNSLSFVIVIIFGFLVSDVLISLRNGNLSFFKILLLGYNFILSIIVQSRALFLIILFYLVIVLITFIKKQKQLRTMFALIIIIFAVFIFLPNSIKSSINDRFSTLATFFDDDYVEVNNSLSARSELLIRGYEIFKENTFFGSGFGSFMFYGGINSQISHNDYLLVLSEQGLVGFTVFIIMLFISVFYSIKNFVYRKNFANLSLLLSLFGVVIYFLFINAYDNILFWVILSFISVNYQENSLKNHEIENLYNLNLNLLEISYENNWFKGNTKC